MKQPPLLRHLAAALFGCLLPLSTLSAQDDSAQCMDYGRPECIMPQQPLAPNRGAQRIGSRQTAPLTCMGNPRVPLVLVQFADKKFQTPSADEAEIRDYYETYCNGEGVAAGKNKYSIRDYFSEQSAGQFAPRFTVLGPVTLSKEAAYYGQNQGSSKDINFNEFCTEAVKLVQEQDVDWMTFDNDGNQTVDMVFFVYAGMGENTSHKTDDIWGREVVRNTTINNITYGCYGCCAELRPKTRDADGNITETEADGIGIFCHELSHALGLPDAYYTGSSSEVKNQVPGMDLFSLMDYGCYAGNGFCPVAYTAYERDFMGWSPLVELNTPQHVTLKPITDGGYGYKVTNPANANEYYVLENRQYVGSDMALARYAHGMLVTHVDYNSSAWSSNSLNNDPNHQRMTFVSAANDPTFLGNAGNNFDVWTRALAAHLWPGTSGNRFLTDESTPAATVFTGGFLGQPIRYITEHADGTITFSFILDEGDGIATPATADADAPAYDLTGRRVKPTHHGLYIKGGRKIVR